MPLIQSGMSLVASSILTSALGFGFWIIAARQYTSAELGISSAVITTMLVVADLSGIGLRTGLVRFLPNAGDDTNRLIVNSYGLAIGIATVGALVFLAGVHLWTPELIGLRSSIGSMALFVLATGFWVIFLLEDSVLLGLRLSPWVPVENGIFGLGKIALLFPLAAFAGELGVFGAWALPVFPIVVVVNVLIRRRLVAPTVAPASSANGDRPAGARTGPSPPSAEVAASGSRQPTRRAIDMREVLSYSLVDWAGSLARTAVIGVIPLIVLVELGSRQSAYYFLAWTIALSVYLLSTNVGDALVAEASYDQGNVDRHTLHSGLLSMAISAPIVLVAVIAAPWILQTFGAEYSREATTVLRLLLLAAIPNVVTRTFVGRLRAERRMASVFAYELALSASVLAVGWALLPAMGINGLGIAWLAMLTVAAGYALIDESLWWWAPKLDSRLVTRLSRISRPVRSIALRLPAPRLDGEIRVALARRYATRPRWRRIGLTADAQTVAVAGHERRPPLRLEVARTERGNEMLDRRHLAIADLGELTGLASFRALLPYPIEYDTSPGRHVLIESAISGSDGAATAGHVPLDDVIDRISEPIADLHRATSGWMTFDAAALDRWVSQPLRSLGHAGRVSPADQMMIGHELCEGLEDTIVPGGRLHGNLVLENALFDPAGRLTGLVNWEWSEDGPVFFDWGSLALSALTVEHQVDLGPLVRNLMDDPEPFLAHRAIPAETLPTVDGRALVLMSWLRSLVPTLRPGSTSRAGRFWMARTVQPAVEHLSVPRSVAV